MRKKLSLLTILFSLTLSASHIETSSIYYKYIGDSTGIANEYLITFTLYKQSGSKSSPLTYDLTVKSSCKPTITLTTHQESIQYIVPDVSSCIDIAPDSSFVRKETYKSTIVLPPCHNWIIYFVECCRSTHTNLSNGNVFNYAENRLNNITGPNSSPIPLNSNPKEFCIGRKIDWNRQYIDPDGDSLYIVPSYIMTFDPIKNQRADEQYNLSYTIISPLDSDTAIGYQVDSKTGNILFKPNQLGNYLLGFSVTEFRKDTSINMWMPINIHTEETSFISTNQCNVDSILRLSNIDTISVCSDSLHFGVNLGTTFFNSSLAIGDFMLLTPNGTPNPIVAQKAIGLNSFESDSIWFTIHYPFLNGGYYALRSRVGPDGNHLKMPCGIEPQLDDTIYIKVKKCSGLSIQEFKKQVHIYPNPANTAIHIRWGLETTAIARLLNLNGELVLYKKLENNSSIDISTLSSGYYILQLELNDNIQRIPVLITK